MTDDGQTNAAASDAEFERFCEEITMASVGETVAKLLTHPFGFHGDTGIRDYLYARLHVHGGDRLDDDDPRPGYPTLLLQSEHYTIAKYISGGETARGARFDLALTRPPAPSCDLEDRCAERLTALFAFELGKNKSFNKVIDPEMVNHSVGTLTGTSDVSKLYRELALHDLQQGWAIEFYDSRGTRGAMTISRALEICQGLDLPAGKRLVVIFVGYSADGGHHVSSNDAAVQTALIEQLGARGLEAVSDLRTASRAPARPPAATSPRASAAPSGTHGWAAAWQPSATIEDVFGDRAAFANRIVRIGGFEERGRKSQYVNLSVARKMNIAQIHPQPGGIGLVLKRRTAGQPATALREIPVAWLAGYKGPNARWLDGKDSYVKKGPAVAYLIPVELDELGDDDPQWRDVLRLLDHAKTLA